MTYPKGSAVVELNQRTSRVAIEWLEPIAPDSALRWDFFDSSFEQKEYGENYVVEKLARDMMAKDPALKAEFEKKLKEDKKFAASPYERLNFFYSRSPWYAANKVGEYPVGRLSSLDAIPLAPDRPMQPAGARPMPPGAAPRLLPQGENPMPPNLNR